MGRVFLPKAQAITYTPKAGETLDKIVQTKCEKADPAITVEEVALFNWGTSATVELLRALVELVGCQKPNPLDPAQSELDPSKGLTGKILLPKVWKKTDLAYETQHKLVVKKQLPATAISITSLDKWFLPGEETCDIDYKLEGVKERAQLLDFDVYASNYCKTTATVTNDFVDYTYTDTPDVPIRQKTVTSTAKERDAEEIGDWKGESEAASGVLAKRAGKTRYINAASSPYTIVLRYSKSPAKTAFINLKSFWPRFTHTAGIHSVAADSLKIKWTAKNLPGGLQGQIQVWDKDNIVFRQFLPAAKCGNGDQEYDWSADGKLLCKEDHMPYRVQIQLHTDKDTDEGFAIAAMHSEVRLYTHPNIGTHGVDHEKEPQVLELAMAPFYAGPAPPEDSGKGRKLRLAKAGYHPGPVNDTEAGKMFQMAVKEFQRDHLNPDKAGERLKADGTVDASTKKAIAALAPGRRPIFAHENLHNITAENDIKHALNAENTEMVIWVDDRHNYTKIAAASNPYLTANMGLENYRGSMDTPPVDTKQARDQQSVPRPWIPLEVAMPVMRKNDYLNTNSIPAINKASRAATGPIRVDWTFRDLPVEYKLDTTIYTATRARPHEYLKEAFAAIKGTQNGKDAWNCTEALGGIRGTDYYAEIYGADSYSLMPWMARKDAGVSAVYSVAHDDLGQDEKQFFDTHQGSAGIYFRPSIIGGDGYQLRAQVSFRDLPGGSTHPNWKVLRDRYDLTQLAQVHSAPLRVWRKDTMRAFIPWAPPAEIHWQTNGSRDVGFAKCYEPAMVHFEHEAGSPQSVSLTTLIAANDYTNLCGNVITGSMGNNYVTNRYRPKNEMVFSAQNLWPWSNVKHLGINAVPPPGVTMGQYETKFLEQNIYFDSWYDYAPPLIHLLIARVEQKKSYLRGHTISEFRSSPQYWKENYRCNQCATSQILIELAAAGGSGAGESCRVAACPGTLASNGNQNFTCDTCLWLYALYFDSAHMEGTPCTQQSAGTMAFISSTPDGHGGAATHYRCTNVRHDNLNVPETGAAIGSLTGTVCGQAMHRNDEGRPHHSRRPHGQRSANERPQFPGDRRTARRTLDHARRRRTQLLGT